MTCSVDRWDVDNYVAGSYTITAEFTAARTKWSAI